MIFFLFAGFFLFSVKIKTGSYEIYIRFKILERHSQQAATLGLRPQATSRRPELYPQSEPSRRDLAVADARA